MDGNPNKCETTPAWTPPLKDWINIHIEQNQGSNGKYYLRLYLNDSHSFTMDFTDTPVTYNSVSFFTGKGSDDRSLV